MIAPFARQPRPFPVADRTRDGELYRTMHPRLAAIDLLRGKCVDGHAGIDVYDPSVFIVDALPHETVWVRTCLGLCGALLGERQLPRRRVRYRGTLEADVRAELDLDVVPPRYIIRDEPLASRGVDSPPEAILQVVHPQRLELVTPLEPLDEPVPISRAAMNRAAQMAALSVDCETCGIAAGIACACTAGERLASAAQNRNEVH